jgi:DNA-binding response OmpR family regulator
MLVWKSWQSARQGHARRERIGLRRKLEADGVGRLIHTVGGVGYTLRPR